MPSRRIGVLYGGRSPEYEISLKSGQFVLQNLASSCSLFLVGVHPRTGRWVSHRRPLSFEAAQRLTPAHLDAFLQKGILQWQGEHWRACPLNLNPSSEQGELFLQGFLDALFPVIHGRDGEDGVSQAVCELNQVPYVGSGLDGSVVSLNKKFTKTFAAQAGVPVLSDCLLLKNNWEKRFQIEDFFQVLESEVLYAKVLHGGSSVGTFRVEDRASLKKALEKAFELESQVLLEPEARGMELFCGFFEPGLPGGATVTVPGSLSEGFFDYEKKYKKPQLQVSIPANLEQTFQLKAQEFALKLAQATRLRGLGRIDFLFDLQKQKLYFNEINTSPGLTERSLYPRLLSHHGLRSEDWLVQLLPLPHS